MYYNQCGSFRSDLSYAVNCLYMLYNLYIQSQLSHFFFACKVWMIILASLGYMKFMCMSKSKWAM